MSRPSVCLSYIHAEDTWSDEYLPISLQVMEAYDWVTQISILITNRSYGHRRNYGKVRFDYGTFGFGHDKPPKDGGIDAIKARNRQLACAQSGDCDWTLLCDTDEWFSYDLIEVIEKADADEKFECIWLELFHLVSPNMHVHNKRHPQARIMDFDIPMFDPHGKVIRNGSGLHFVPNVNEEFRLAQPNPTSHPDLSIQRNYKQVITPGPYHFHMRYLLDPKRGHDYAAHDPPEGFARSYLAGLSLPNVVEKTWQQHQYLLYGEGALQPAKH